MDSGSSSSETENLNSSPPSYKANASYNTFCEPKAGDQFQNARIRTAAAMLEPVVLSELKKSSAFTQCPHCLHFIYTDVSVGYERLSFIPFWIWGLFSLHNDSISLSFVLMSVLSVFTVSFYTLNRVHHSCPSCSKKIATYHNLQKTISITAPAIAPPPDSNV